MKTDLNIENKKLVKSLKRGDINAFNDLYKKYGTKLLFFTIGYVYSKEDAEDIVQEVFLKIWRKRKQLKVQRSFNSYVFTIAYNAIKKYYRKKGVEKRHLELFLNNYKLVDNTTSLRVECNDLKNQVGEIINAFPERRKEIFKLSRELHLSNKEIAVQLNITKKTVENHITTSLKDLRIKLNMPLFFIICLSFF